MSPESKVEEMVLDCIIDFLSGSIGLQREKNRTNRKVIFGSCQRAGGKRPVKELEERSLFPISVRKCCHLLLKKEEMKEKHKQIPYQR